MMFVPSEYAACPGEQSQTGGRRLDPTTILEHLPAPARALLRGTQRTYTTFGLSQEVVDCYALTPQKALVVMNDPQVNWWFDQDITEGADPGIQFSVVLPHGRMLSWVAEPDASISDRHSALPYCTAGIARTDGSR